jgi:Zn-dependent oligopeptidase
MAKKLSPIEQKASLKALSDYRGEAQRLMKDKMKNLKKVTVASDSEEGLLSGLEKAEDVLENKDKIVQSMQGMESEDEMEEESEDEMEDDSEEMCTEEELDAKIQELMAKKKALKSSY